MQTFKEFLNEQETTLITDAPDKNLLEENLDVLNNDLDAVTDKPFVNNLVFVNAVRGTLERYGIKLPAGYESFAMSIEAESVYSMDNDSGYYLYMVFNLNPDGYVEGYAQIVDEDDLQDLLSIDSEDVTEKSDDVRDEVNPNMSEPSHYNLQVRRTDD